MTSAGPASTNSIVSIDVAGVEEEGEFPIPVIGPDVDDGGPDDEGGGHGH